jgi:hypothetical protein
VDRQCLVHRLLFVGAAAHINHWRWSALFFGSAGGEASGEDNGSEEDQGGFHSVLSSYLMWIFVLLMHRRYPTAFSKAPPYHSYREVQSMQIFWSIRIAKN